MNSHLKKRENMMKLEYLDVAIRFSVILMELPLSYGTSTPEGKESHEIIT